MCLALGTSGDAGFNQFTAQVVLCLEGPSGGSYGDIVVTTQPSNREKKSSSRRRESGRWLAGPGLGKPAAAGIVAAIGVGREL